MTREFFKNDWKVRFCHNTYETIGSGDGKPKTELHVYALLDTDKILKQFLAWNETSKRFGSAEHYKEQLRKWSVKKELAAVCNGDAVTEQGGVTIQGMRIAIMDMNTWENLPPHLDDDQ